MHSDFAMIIQHEQDKATLVFDSALIQNEMDDSSIYNLPAYMPEHLDPVLLENMELEEILELEKMLNRHIYEDSWD